MIIARTFRAKSRKSSQRKKISLWTKKAKQLTLQTNGMVKLVSLLCFFNDCIDPRFMSWVLFRSAETSDQEKETHSNVPPPPEDSGPVQIAAAGQENGKKTFYESCFFSPLQSRGAPTIRCLLAEAD